MLLYTVTSMSFVDFFGHAVQLVRNTI